MEAAPSALLGKYYIDLSEGSNFKSNYDDLINTLYGKSPKKPIIKRKETKKDENIKFELAVERIMGRAWFVGSEIRYEAGELFSEDDIKEISRNLERYMDYTKKEYWIPVLTRAEVDDLIDGSNWKKDGKKIFFNEPERQKLMERCAEAIKFRLNGYSKRYTVRYKIFDKGDVGFRYELMKGDCNMFGRKKYNVSGNSSREYLADNEYVLKAYEIMQNIWHTGNQRELIELGNKLNQVICKSLAEGVSRGDLTTMQMDLSNTIGMIGICNSDDPLSYQRQSILQKAFEYLDTSF